MLRTLMTHLSLGGEGEVIFSRNEWQQGQYKHSGRTPLHHISPGMWKINLYLQILFLLFLQLPNVVLLKYFFFPKSFDPQHTLVSLLLILSKPFRTEKPVLLTGQWMFLYFSMSDLLKSVLLKNILCMLKSLWCKITVILRSWWCTTEFREGSVPSSSDRKSKSSHLWSYF